MPDLDDGIRRELERLARPGDPSGALDRVTRAKRRIRVMRRVQAAALAVVVVVGTAGAVLALGRAFRMPNGPAGQPTPGPTVSVSPAEAACPGLSDTVLDEDGEEMPEGYRPVGQWGGGNVLGDGHATRARVFEDRARPHRCRYLLVIEHPGGVVYLAPIRTFQWLPDVPFILASAEIDGESGVEVVIDFGGPGHPHRSGQVFTYERGGSSGEGKVVPMELVPTPGVPSILFPLGGEFAAGVDCADEPGTVVTTVGALAAGGDTHYDITRTTYRADGAMFVEVTSESFTVPVGEEDERWPELADDPFRSCPSA